MTHRLFLKSLGISAFLMLLCHLSMLSIAPYYSIRSQGVDSARNLVGQTKFIHQYNNESSYCVLSFTPEYSRTFRSNRIFNCLFGANVCNSTTTTTSCNTSCSATCGSSSSCSNQARCITISGSETLNRGANDWLADYFGLPVDFQSSICFSPRITNFILDANFFVSLDCALCGLYLVVDAPVVSTQWDLQLCETVKNAGISGFRQGYFAEQAVARSSLYQNFVEFVGGSRGLFFPATVNSANNVLMEPLKFAKMSTCKLSESTVAEVRVTLGWDIWQCENSHFGFNFRFAGATGTRPHALFLFEPVVGNGHSWEVGGGFSGHWDLWNGECGGNISLWLEGYLTHLFATRQKRTFDLVGKPMSRYMLAEKLGTPVANLFGLTASGAVAPAAQFQGTLTPVANLSTIDVKVHSGVQADVTALFNYTNCNISVDVGYNFWARSCEKISLYCTCDPQTPLTDGKTWALKGDASVFGFRTSNNAAIPLSATQTGATPTTGANIHAGTNTPIGTPFSLAQRTNPIIDNVFPARSTVAGDNLTTLPAGVTQINTSVNPIFIQQADLDICGARTKGISNRVFAHLSYAWNDCECWIPFLGIGGSVEFAHSNCDKTNCTSNTTTSSSCTDSCDTSCSSSCQKGGCQTCNPSQWAIWLKGGISFN